MPHGGAWYVIPTYNNISNLQFAHLIQRLNGFDIAALKSDNMLSYRAAFLILFRAEADGSCYCQCRSGE